MCDHVQGLVEPLVNIPHRAEVQSLTLEARAEGRSVLGSIDSYGRAIVAEVSAVDAGPITVKAQYELTPPVNEGGDKHATPATPDPKPIVPFPLDEYAACHGIFIRV